MIHLASRRNYGVPRVTAELRRQGRLVNHKRVERVVREHGIAGRSRRTGRRSLTKADTTAAPSPDLIGRDFPTARADLFDFVETFHNRRRLRKHIHWGCLTPHKTRLRHRRDQALAA